VLGSDFFNTKAINGLLIGLLLLVHRPHLRFLNYLNLLSNNELVDRLFKAPLELFLRARFLVAPVWVEVLILPPCYLLLLPSYVSLTTELSCLAHLIPLEAEADPAAARMLLLWRSPHVTEAQPHFLLYVAPALLQAVPDQVVFGEDVGEVCGLKGLLLGGLGCQEGRGLGGREMVELGGHKLGWLLCDGDLVEGLVEGVRCEM
jgi:hypothetical protein